MIEKKVKSDRQFAASLARKYFGGGISKHELFDDYPDYRKDIKLALLYKALEREPKISWLFGVSKEKHSEYLIQTTKLINDLDSTIMKPETLHSLFKELWFHSSNCTTPIQNIGLRLLEVAKYTNNTVDDVREYFHILLENNCMEITSKEPLLYQFTEKGRSIKTLTDMEQILNDDFRL